ncbi:MAG TPA: hypothetical protein VF076_08340 [Acidimicrobiales bacterium]
MAPAATNEVGTVPTTQAGRRSEPAVRARGAVLAAFTAVALGTIAMIGFAAGNHRWDGPVMIHLAGSHGIHYVDVLGVVPLGAGVLLAVWGLRRRAERTDGSTRA